MDVGKVYSKSESNELDFLKYDLWASSEDSSRCLGQGNTFKVITKFLRRIGFMFKT